MAGVRAAATGAWARVLASTVDARQGDGGGEGAGGDGGGDGGGGGLGGGDGGDGGDGGGVDGDDEGGGGVCNGGPRWRGGLVAAREAVAMAAAMTAVLRMVTTLAVGSVAVRGRRAGWRRGRWR